MTLRFTKGRCPRTGQWLVPLRDEWGFTDKRPLSPSLERKLCATAAETGSYEKAATLAAEWGASLSGNAVRSCVLHLGLRAAENPLDAPCQERAGPGDTLVIMADGWMARHRGKGWGFSFKESVEGWNAVEWREIKSAVIYRLRDQTSTGSKRGALLHKHVVATPAGTGPVVFGRRVHHEALRMGLAQAQRVYLVMDGALWLWNLFEERFAAVAVGTLDFYHASQHIHELAAVLFGEEAKEWAGDLLGGLRRRGPSQLYATLADLAAAPPDERPETQEAIRKAAGYFEGHEDHLDYPGAEAEGWPIGSGSIESQCSQFQNRFKRRGQFWSELGFAALMEVVCRHQNGELQSLWAA